MANYGDDSLTRIRTEDNSTETIDISSISTGGPQALAFDGANIWIGFGNSDGIGYYNVATRHTEHDVLLGQNIHNLTFDGTYIWATNNSGAIMKIATGAGSGTEAPTITKGLLMYNTAGSLRCISISGTTISASATLTNCQ